MLDSLVQLGTVLRGGESFVQFTMVNLIGIVFVENDQQLPLPARYQM